MYKYENGTARYISRVATLILIIIGVVGGIMTLGFVTSFTTQTANSMLKIEGARIEGDTIGVTNIGTNQLRITSVLLLDNSMNLIDKADVSTTISASESTELTAIFSATIQPGQRYVIKVLGADGSSAVVAGIKARGSSAWRVEWYTISGNTGSLGNKVGEGSMLNYEWNWGPEMCMMVIPII